MSDLSKIKQKKQHNIRFNFKLRNLSTNNASTYSSHGIFNLSSIITKKNKLLNLCM